MTGKRLLTLAVVALAIGLLAPAQAMANGGGSRVVVTPDDMKGWAFAQETPNGSGMMVHGPGTPPLGRGSAQLQVDSTGGWILAKAAYQGTYFRDFTRLTYWTYRQMGAPPFAIALQFNIDRDLTDADESFQGRAVYEPYYTHPVLTGVWQRWNTQDNATAGNWWFTRPPQNTPVTGCSIADPCTWSEMLTKFPNLGVHRSLGAVILKAGGGWVGGFTGNTDALSVGVRYRTTIYDFEPSGGGDDDCPDDDQDDDGLTDSRELALLTLPMLPDSDRDGIRDGNDDANRNGEDDEDEDDDHDSCPNDDDDDGEDDEDEDDNGGSHGSTVLVDDDLQQCPRAQFQRIQDGVNAVSPGGTVLVCPGTYVEQVTIPAAKNGITVRSQVYRAAVIKAPQPVMAEPGDIVHVAGARNVTIQNFTIAGPLPDLLFCSLTARTGVRVGSNGSATIVGNHITEIRSTNPALRGCQNGIAILVGRVAEGEVGQAVIRGNLIDKYQKGAIVISNVGSRGWVYDNTTQGDGPTPVIAQNGIQVSGDAVADVIGNRVFDHTYSLAPATGGTGILLFGAGAGTKIGDNYAARNDDNIGAYDTTGVTIYDNRLLDATFFDGIYMGADTSNNLIKDNFLRGNTEHDCHDDSVGPNNPPALVANRWVDNDGLTENRPGLCDGANGDDDDDEEDDEDGDDDDDHDDDGDDDDRHSGMDDDDD